jgi:hypothetical protein
MHPAFAAGRDAAAGDDRMHVGMKEQILPPRMKNRKEADVGAEMFRVGRNPQQGLGGGAEENAEQGFLVA